MPLVATRGILCLCIPSSMIPSLLHCTASALKLSTVLTRLRICKCDLDAAETARLLQSLSDSPIPTLQMLDLSRNRVDLRGAKQIGKHCLDPQSGG